MRRCQNTNRRYISDGSSSSEYVSALHFKERKRQNIVNEIFKMRTGIVDDGRLVGLEEPLLLAGKVAMSA